MIPPIQRYLMATGFFTIFTICILHNVTIHVIVQYDREGQTQLTSPLIQELTFSALQYFKFFISATT